MSSEEWLAYAQAHRTIIDETENGAFSFTVDRRSSEQTLVIYARYNQPQRGQASHEVASIAAMWGIGDFENCELVDGSVEPWPFQEST